MWVVASEQGRQFHMDFAGCRNRAEVLDVLGVNTEDRHRHVTGQGVWMSDAWLRLAPPILAISEMALHGRQ